MNKLANLKLGLADGPWVDATDPVVARYDKGVQTYQVGGKNTGLEMSAVRARAFEGLLLRVRSYRESAAPLVLAIGGRGSSNYDQNPAQAAFNPGDCRGTQITFADNTLTLSGKGATVFASGSVPLGFTAADPAAVAKGPKALLDTPAAKNAVAVLAPENRIILQPSFPLEWRHASIRCPAVAYQYAWDGGTETMAIQTPRKLSPTIRLRARRAEIAEVSVNGKRAEYAIEPGIGMAWIVISGALSKETQVTIEYGDDELPKAVAPEDGIVGGVCTVRVERGRIESVRQSKIRVDQTRITDNGTTCSFPLPSEAGVATYFVRLQHRDVQLWLPVEVDVRRAVLADKNPPQADKVGLQAIPLDLSKFLNQRLADLHRNNYIPRIESFYWANRDGFRTVSSNGRSWWESHGKRGISPDTSSLTRAKGRLVADNGIPFAVSAVGNDAVFTSRYHNFPARIEIPVNQRARKVGVLIAASISLAQSRMDNGRVRILLGDGTHRDLVLRNPETIDDWLGSGLGQPYALSGQPVPLGKDTHARLHEIDLGGDHIVKSVELETFTHETMIGILGITLMQQKES